MRLCPQCRTPYFPNAIFCESCGAPLRTLQEDAGGPTTASLPGSGPLRAVTLEVRAGGRRVELNLGSEALVLGRADQSTGLKPALDLTEDGGVEGGVSRRHARLMLKGDQVLLEDLDSANGTWINDVRARPHQPFPLRHGDIVRLGRVSLRVRLVAKH